MLDKITRYLSRQYVRRRLAEIVAPGYPILLDYPLKCSHRCGYSKPPHQQLFAMLEAGRNEYAKRLAAFCSLKGLLSQIPADESTPEAIEPCWGPPEIFQQFGRSRTLRHAVRISAQKVRGGRFRVFC